MSVQTPPGRAVQVDPIEPTLKAPGAKALKLKYDEPPSNFAINSDLRRCCLGRSPEGAAVGARAKLLVGRADVPKRRQARSHSRAVQVDTSVRNLQARNKLSFALGP